MVNLGLVVVDEQHRFGVAQRQRLRQTSGAMPNYLAMTATPIPRSLSNTLYGDVDLSELREMPPGRQHRRDPASSRRTSGPAPTSSSGPRCVKGRQAFVICPLIEESDKLGARSATAEYERLSTTVFPDLRVELLHGRMPAREKAERMERFVRGDADVLVATSVVEVGRRRPQRDRSWSSRAPSDSGSRSCTSFAVGWDGLSTSRTACSSRAGSTRRARSGSPRWRQPTAVSSLPSATSSCADPGSSSACASTDFPRCSPPIFSTWRWPARPAGRACMARPRRRSLRLEAAVGRDERLPRGLRHRLTCAGSPLHASRV